MADNLVKYLSWKRTRAMYANQAKEDGPSVAAVTLMVNGGRRALEDADMSRNMVEVLEEISRNSPFELLAYSLLPDHLNLLLMAHSPEASVKRFITEIRARTTRAYHEGGGKGRLWQEYFFDHPLSRGENLSLAAQKVFLVPVEKGLVRKPGEWPFAWVAAKMPW
jgi:REP element-mobilizing transposase RayT